MNSFDIDKIVKYIRDNIEDDVTLEDIAKHMNYSKYHLSRSFKREMGSTIKQYIEAIRVEKGIKKILENEDSLTDIAYDVKYKNLSTFSRVFKKQTAVSPKKYREESSYAYKFLTKWLKNNSVMVHYDTYLETGNSFSIRIKYPDGYEPKITCIGFFPEPMPKGEPVVGIASTDVLEFTIDNLPNGEYYLFLCEIMENFSLLNSYILNDNYRAGVFEPFAFYGDTHHKLEVRMRRPIDSDPPININLPLLLMRTFVKRVRYNVRRKFY